MLSEEYLDGMLTSRPLAKPFVDACLAKLLEVRRLHIGCIFNELSLIGALSDKRQLCSGVFAESEFRLGDITPGMSCALSRLSHHLTIIQRVCIALPSAFVSPRTWCTHSDLIIEVLTPPSIEDSHSSEAELEHPSRISSEVCQILIAHLHDIKRRNDALLFRNLPKTALAHLGSTVMDIQVCLLLTDCHSSVTDL